MKPGIHPNYEKTTITCACGNVIEVGSTKKDIKVETVSYTHLYSMGIYQTSSQAMQMEIMQH